MWFLAEAAGKVSSINPDRPSGSERGDLFSHPGGRVDGMGGWVGVGGKTGEGFGGGTVSLLC